MMTGISPERKVPETHPDAVATGLRSVAHQHPWRSIGLIAGYEYRKRLRQRSFIISTIIILILIALGTCVPTVIQYITATSTSQTKVAVINNAGPIAGMSTDGLRRTIDQTLNGTASQTAGTTTTGQGTSGNARYAIQIAPASSINALKNQLKSGVLSVLLVIDRSSNQDLRFTYYTNAASISDTNVTQIQALANRLSLLDTASRLGLTPEQTGNLFAQPAFSVVNVGQAQNSKSVGDTVAGYILAYIGIVLIFISIYLYGYGVAAGVAEEKGSRIMEILVNAATPFQLMAGKIVGIGAAGLTQMVMFVVVGIGGLLLQNPIKAAIIGNAGGGLTLNISSTSIMMLLLLLVYFILGFLLYASIFAAVGALVKRQEEIQNAVQLPVWLFMVGYFISFFGIYSPDASWIKFVSYIPFWSPTIMLMRIGMGSVAWWEIILTVVLMLGASYICAFISARIYRHGILMYGQKPGLGQLVRMVRTK